MILEQVTKGASEASLRGQTRIAALLAVTEAHVPRPAGANVMEVAEGKAGGRSALEGAGHVRPQSGPLQSKYQAEVRGCCEETAGVPHGPTCAAWRWVCSPPSAPSSPSPECLFIHPSGKATLKQISTFQLNAEQRGMSWAAGSGRRKSRDRTLGRVAGPTLVPHPPRRSACLDPEHIQAQAEAGTGGSGSFPLYGPRPGRNSNAEGQGVSQGGQGDRLDGP